MQGECGCASSPETLTSSPAARSRVRTSCTRATNSADLTSGCSSSRAMTSATSCSRLLGRRFGSAGAASFSTMRSATVATRSRTPPIEVDDAGVLDRLGYPFVVRATARRDAAAFPSNHHLVGPWSHPTADREHSPPSIARELRLSLTLSRCRNVSTTSTPARADPGRKMVLNDAPLRLATGADHSVPGEGGRKRRVAGLMPRGARHEPQDVVRPGGASSAEGAPHAFRRERELANAHAGEPGERIAHRQGARG